MQEGREACSQCRHLAAGEHAERLRGMRTGIASGGIAGKRAVRGNTPQGASIAGSASPWHFRAGASLAGARAIARRLCAATGNAAGCLFLRLSQAGLGMVVDKLPSLGSLAAVPAAPAAAPAAAQAIQAIQAVPTAPAQAAPPPPGTTTNTRHHQQAPPAIAPRAAPPARYHQRHNDHRPHLRLRRILPPSGARVRWHARKRCMPGQIVRNLVVFGTIYVYNYLARCVHG